MADSRWSSTPSNASKDDGAQYVDYHPSTLHPSGSSTPLHPQEDARLLASPTSPVPHDHTRESTSRSAPPSSFVSSPLNPSPMNASTSRPLSRSSTSKHLSHSHSLFTATPSATSDDASLMAHLGLGSHSSGLPPSFGPRGSMILYRLADDPVPTKDQDVDPLLPRPPRKLHKSQVRGSVLTSSSRSSIVSSTSESKYPSGFSARGLVPYAYDPALDESTPLDEEDHLHDPMSKGGFRGESGGFPWRGVLNVGVLIVLIMALLCLFVLYPVFTFFRDQEMREAIEGNSRINDTGQVAVLFQMPDPIDSDTPQSALTRTGFDGQQYDLVFSDEFNAPGRTFYKGDDPFWEAVDLWYGATGDVEYYDPQQVTTRNGSLVITMDSTSTGASGVTPGSTAPFTTDSNHGLQYRSGMLQSWNKFCFTTGYIEVNVMFPGPDENTQGYWPGAWTMGNLARPGYPATTDGLWPYTYDSCDVGTFPNQTDKDGLGPAAALHSDQSRAKYNYELSWLPGQRLSACSCPGSDHPGPSVSHGRGAPELDIFETEKDNDFPTGQVVSQSAQFAPFSHDYTYLNDSTDWTNFNTSRTRANTYRGSAVQQSVSALTRVPSDMFQGVAGSGYRTFGFEYWSDPSDRNGGSVTWQVDGQPSYRIQAGAVGPDTGDGGSGVGQRLIPEEPMSIVLNLGMSPNWQTIDLSTMMFPAEFKIDYVRVYQRKGQMNIGCDPTNYPTKDYIDKHYQAYTNANLTSWQWDKPKNSLYDGC